MINYDLILYIGLFLIVGSFILFILYEMDKRKKDKELFKQQQLIPMTEEEEYRNAGIIKEEINKDKNHNCYSSIVTHINGKKINS